MARPFCLINEVVIAPVVPEASGALEYAALFAQLDAPSDGGMVACGYADLMARINSPTFRRRAGRD